MILDKVYADFQSTPVRATTLVERYGNEYSHNYLRTVLANSERSRDHSKTYPFRTVRVACGLYKVYPN